MSTLSWACDITPLFLTSVLGYAVDSISFSGKVLEQSNVAVLTLNGGSNVLFLKRSSLAWILLQDPDRTEAQQLTSICSFRNELAFLSQGKEELDNLKVAGCAVPLVYYSSCATSGSTLRLEAPWHTEESIYTILMEYLPPTLYSEETIFNERATFQALSWMASFHSYYAELCLVTPTTGPGISSFSTLSTTTNHSAATAAASSLGLFDQGTWWHRALLTLNVSSKLLPAFQFHCKHLPEYSTLHIGSKEDLELVEWVALHANRLVHPLKSNREYSGSKKIAEIFSTKSSFLSSPSSTSSSSSNTTEAAAVVAAASTTTTSTVSPRPSRFLKTLLHGDVKTSNMFFLEKEAAVAVNNTGAQATAEGSDEGFRKPIAFDFQWTGWGSSGAADVAYLIFGGVSYKDVLHSEDALMSCLAAYFQEFSRKAPKDVAESYSFDQFLCDFECETVIYWIVAMILLLPALTPKLAEENKAKYGWLTCEYDPRVTALLTKRSLRTLAEWRERRDLFE